MIIYHTVSTYHILRSILHKMNYRSHEEAVLLTPKRFLKLPYGLKNENGIFSKVIFYDWEFKQYENYPNDVFDDIEKTLIAEIGDDYETKIDEYNVFNAARFFGSFLATKGIHFNWFEEADGRYIEYEPPMLDDERMHPRRYELASELGLYSAENDLIDTIYLSIEDNPGVEESSKIKNFDAQDELEKLSGSNLEKMLRFWGVEKVENSIEKNSALLMSQHFCNIRIISFEEQVLLYQMFVDYFLEGRKLYLKMHPSDYFPYLEFVDNIQEIKADYPAELMQFAIDGKFDIVASVSSTGVLNLKNISDKQLCINQEYTVNFRDNDLYYFASKLCQLFGEYKLMVAGIDSSILNAMLCYSLHEENVSGIKEYKGETHIEDTILIVNGNVDDELLQAMVAATKRNVVICFLSVKGNVSELEMIKKYPASTKTIVTRSCEDEEMIGQKHIIVISDDENNMRKVNEMNYYKLLKNTGLTVRVDPNSDKDTQILALTGMLEATEKTLACYVEENKILKEQLSGRE